jgi:TolC family type I secretion outer membrane protein
MVVPVTGYSQSVIEILTLDDCVKIALENNSDLNTSRNLAEIAKLGVRGSYSNILPSVNASFQGGYMKFGPSSPYLSDEVVGIDSVTGEYIYDQVSRQDPARSRDSYSAGISISQNIFDGGYWWNNIRRSKTLREAGQYDLKLSENQIMKFVSQYYYNLLKDIKLLEVDSLAVKRSQDQVDRTQSMFEIGSVAQVDVYRALVNLGQDQITYLNQKNTLRQSEQLLNLAMGRDPLTTLQIDTVVIFEPKKVTLQDLLDLSIEHQPALQSQKLNVKAAEFSLALSKSPFWPSLGARFNYSRDHDELEKVFSDFDQNWSYSIGVGLSWNLFNGFSDHVNYQTSKLQLKNAHLSLENYQRTLRSDIRNLFNSYNAILEIVEINKKNLEAAREEFRLADERYRLGSGTSLELREAQVNLTQAEQILVAAEYNAIITYIELAEAIGRVKEAMNL